MDVNSSNNLVQLPFGFKIGLIKVSKNGFTSNLRIINGMKKNMLFAIFDEEGVDFKLLLDNSLCCRGIRISININNKRYNFYISPGKVSFLETLESNGRKLHFKSQNTDEGQLLVSTSAHRHGISYSESAINCSKITFNIDVEKLIEINDWKFGNIIGNKIIVKIETLAGKTVYIEIGTENTVKDLKRKFAEKESVSSEMTLIFNNKQLEDNNSLSYCGIRYDSTLYVILYNSVSNPTINNTNIFNQNIYSQINGQNSERRKCLSSNGWNQSLNNTSNSIERNESSLFGLSSRPQTLGIESSLCGIGSQNGGQYGGQYGRQIGEQVFCGERGVICFGDYSDQKFTPYNGFIQDYNLLINEFIIEMRMTSKYEPI